MLMQTGLSTRQLIEARPKDVKRLAKYLRVDQLAFDYDDLIMLVGLATAEGGMVPR
jgi:acetone carboxylase gamma subunit